MRTALVTGGCGFVGSHVVDLLLERSWHVRVLDDLSTGNVRNLLAPGASGRVGVEFRHGDVRDMWLVTELARGADVCFHLAAVPSVQRSLADPQGTHDVNVGGTLSVLRACSRAGVRRLVYSASSSAYGGAGPFPQKETLPPSPRSPYAAQKLAGEMYCEAFDALGEIETVRLRYFNVYGPRQSPDSEYAAVVPKFVAAALARTAPVIYGDGRQTRDFTYVHDVARANLIAADAENAAGWTINVAGGRSFSVLDLWNGVQAATGFCIAPQFKARRSGDVLDSGADLTAARQVLGYVPCWTLTRGLAATVEHMRGR